MVATPSPDGPRIGRFLQLERIAAGGMASVFRACTTDPNDPLAGKDLAIKLLHEHLAEDDEFVRMFRDEGRVAMQLLHPSIVRVFEVGEDRGRHFLVMERIEGRNLARVLESVAVARRTLPRPVTVAVMRSILEALQYVHALPGRGGRSMGLVHRDISPHNILIASDERVLLTDFGIARGDHRSDRTRTGTVKGKLHYMSPEQARGAEVDARADLYSLAVVAYEMLTSKPILGAEATQALQARVASGRIALDEQALRGLPEDLRHWLQQALQPERDRRFDDAASMLAAFNAVKVVAAARIKPGTLRQQLESASVEAGARPQMLFRPGELSKRSSTVKPVPLPPGMVLTPQRPISGSFVGASHVAQIAGGSVAARLTGQTGNGASNRAPTLEGAGELGAGAEVIALSSRRGAGGPAGTRSADNPVRRAEAASRRSTKAAVVDGNNVAALRSEAVSLRAAGGDPDDVAPALALHLGGGEAKAPARAQKAKQPPEPIADLELQRSAAFASLVAWSCVAVLVLGVLLEVWNAQLTLPRVNERSFVALREQVFATAARWTSSAGSDAQDSAAVAAGHLAGAEFTATTFEVMPIERAPRSPEPLPVRNDRFLPRGVAPTAEATAEHAAAAGDDAAPAHR